jgi:myo-inositol-1(or 4)-monophosphatase
MSSINEQFLLERIIEMINPISEILKNNFLSLKEDKIFYKENETEIVTQIDLDINHYTINFLKKFFPNACFISEENLPYYNYTNNSNNNAHKNNFFDINDELNIKEELIFIIDPVDGTSNYAYGLNQFCFSLGVMSYGKMIGGIIIAPLTKEIFYGMRNCGAFYQFEDKIQNINEIYSNLTKKNHKYLIGTTYPCINLVYNKLSKRISVRIIGSIALTICYALIGKFDGFISNSSKIWDIAGAIGIASNIKNFHLFIKFYSEKNKYSLAIHREESQFQILQNILLS